jgi:guanylate kinase
MSSEVVANPGRSEEQGPKRSPGVGRLIVVSAPSGAGKSSLVERVLSRIDHLRASVSCTTRQARGAEKDGLDYNFVSKEQFAEMRDRGEFLEWAEVHGHLYGTPRQPVREALEAGEDMILDIDVKGADQIRRQMPAAITIFVLPPTRGVLESRLASRNLNTPNEMERRMRNAENEVRNFERFEYIIVNDDLERASAALEAIIVADRHRAARQRETASRIVATFGGGSSDA